MPLCFNGQGKAECGILSREYQELVLITDSERSHREEFVSVAAKKKEDRKIDERRKKERDMESCSARSGGSAHCRIHAP